jgi:hypothetical protein
MLTSDSREGKIAGRRAAEVNFSVCSALGQTTRILAHETLNPFCTLAIGHAGRVVGWQRPEFRNSRFG